MTRHNTATMKTPHLGRMLGAPRFASNDEPDTPSRDWRSIRLSPAVQEHCDRALSVQMAQQDGYEMVGGAS